MAEVKPLLRPSEFLARWDDDTGEYVAAHAAFVEHTMVDGVSVAKKLLPAMTPEQAAALGFPFPAVLTRMQSDGLIALDQANARIAELEREKAALIEGHAAELAAKDANLQTLLAEVDALRTDADALQAALTEAQQAANAGFFTKLAGLFAR